MDWTSDGQDYFIVRVIQKEEKQGWQNSRERHT